MALRPRKRRGKASGEGGTGEPGRLAQLRQAYKFTRETDRWLGLWLLGSFVVPVAVLVGIGLLTGTIIFLGVLAVLVGLVVAMSIFTRRVQKASYASVAGQPGVAAGLVERMRGDWRVTPAVQLTRDQDFVHRVIGRPGVILLAEGRGSRALIANETRRLRKVIGDTPVHTIVVGDGAGETPLPKLQVTIMKLPRTLRPAEVSTLEARLKALPAGGPALPVPKGPMPTRVPRGKIR
jgi:hypothetical protein